MSKRRELVIQISLIIGIVFFTQALNLFAIWQNNSDYVFGGIYFNPLDGYSYLAKMRQGWEGDWQFHLPYTSEKGKGSYLFIFYLLLGHISRWLGLELPVMFHLTRFLSTLLLYLVLFKFIKKYFNDPSMVKPAYLLCGLGSGLGWLSLLLGKVTPDFWLAEAYPLFSSFANPHFPLGIALMLILLYDIDSSEPYTSKALVLRNIFLSICLALIFPFGIILALAIATIAVGIKILTYKSSRLEIKKKEGLSLIQNSLAILGGGFPVILYQVWVIRSDILLSNWNAQNVTPLPKLSDLIIAFLPVILLSLLGGLEIVKKGLFEQRLILIWGIVGIGLSLIPFALQRRFLMGVYIPLSLLSLIGLKSFIRRLNLPEGYIWFKRAFVGLLILSIPTNAMIGVITLNAIKSHNPLLFLYLPEKEAFRWIDTNLPKDAIILAGVDTSLFIPAFTGRRVIYGHPFETVNAQEEKAYVADYFANRIESENALDAVTTLRQKKIGYIFWGPRERELAGAQSRAINSPYLLPVYQNSGVTIYKVLP